MKRYSSAFKKISMSEHFSQYRQFLGIACIEGCSIITCERIAAKKAEVMAICCSACQLFSLCPEKC